MTRSMTTCQKIFLYLFAFFLPISISGAELSLGLMTISLLIITLSNWRRSPFFPIPLLIPLLVFLAGHLASSFSGPDPLDSLASIDWVFIAMPVTVAAMRVIGNDRRPVLIFLTVGVIVSIYAIVQHFTGIDVVRPPGNNVVPPMEGVEGRYLAIGTFCHHLTYAHLYQFTFLFLFTFAARHQSDGKSLLLILSATILVGLSLVFSYSRGVWISATICAILVVLVSRGKKGTVYTILSVVIMLLILSADGSLGDRIKSVASQDANAQRLIIFQSNWDAIKDHPIIGIGPGRYQETMMPYYERYNPPDIMPRVHAHNNFMQVWLNAGLIGLAGFIWLNVAFLRLIWIHVKREKSRESRDGTILLAGFAGVLAFLISGLTQYNLGDSEVAMTYWFVMGIALWVLEGREGIT